MTADTVIIDENEPTPVRKVVTRQRLDKIALDQSDITYAYVAVPEWAIGDEDPSTIYAYVRGLTGSERDSFEGSIIVFKGKQRSVNMENARAKLVAKCLVDPNTKEPIYKPNEIVQLGKRSAAVIDRLYDEIRKLSGISDTDDAELKDNLKNE